MELSLTSKRTTLKTAQKYCAADIVFDNTMKFTVTCNVMYLW